MAIIFQSLHLLLEFSCLHVLRVKGIGTTVESSCFWIVNNLFLIYYRNIIFYNFCTQCYVFCWYTDSTKDPDWCIGFSRRYSLSIIIKLLKLHSQIRAFKTFIGLSLVIRMINAFYIFSLYLYLVVFIKLIT